LLVAAVSAAWACGAINNELDLAPSNAGHDDMSSSSILDSPPAEFESIVGPVDETRATPVTEPSADRKIIKEGDIRFRSDDVRKTRATIDRAVAECSGYISNDNHGEENGRTDYHLTIRVPAENFDLLLDRICSTVDKLDGKSVNARDVTEEYIDLEARIITKKELEERFIELLRRSGSMEEALKVEREIGDLRTEIESLEGRLNYMESRIAYSTLAITYYNRVEVKTEKTGFGFGGKFFDALSSGWHVLLWIVIGMAHLWPFVLLGVALALALWYIIRRNRRRKQ
jgi:hypothetical protein